MLRSRGLCIFSFVIFIIIINFRYALLHTHRRKEEITISMSPEQDDLTWIPPTLAPSKSKQRIPSSPRQPISLPLSQPLPISPLAPRFDSIQQAHTPQSSVVMFLPHKQTTSTLPTSVPSYLPIKPPVAQLDHVFRPTSSQSEQVFGFSISPSPAQSTIRPSQPTSTDLTLDLKPQQSKFHKMLPGMNSSLNPPVLRSIVRQNQLQKDALVAKKSAMVEAIPLSPGERKIVPLSLLSTPNVSISVPRLMSTRPVIASQKHFLSPHIKSCFEDGCRNPWLDTDKRRIEAHGGGILELNDEYGNFVYYWFGESAKEDERATTSPSLTQRSRDEGRNIGITCYKASGLGGPWKFLGVVLSKKDVTRALLKQALTDNSLRGALRLSNNEKNRTGDEHFKNCNPHTWKHCPDLAPGHNLIMERPKVIYNPHSKKYVLWLHLDITGGSRNRARSGAVARKKYHHIEKISDISKNSSDEAYPHMNNITTRGTGNGSIAAAVQDDPPVTTPLRQKKYWFRRAGIAVADSPSGPYIFKHSLLPDGKASLDLQLFQDIDDQKDREKTTHTPQTITENSPRLNTSASTFFPPPPAYLIRSVDNEYVAISRLTDDYLQTKGIISSIRPALEGMAVFRLSNGTYYAIFSHLTGWEPNPLVLLRAEGPNLEDPRWVSMGNPTHEPKSYNLQPAFVLRLRDCRGRPYHTLMADNWKHAGPRGLRDAGYIWLPLIFSTHSVRLQRISNWSTCRPFASPPLKWENATSLHARATSLRATTLPSVKNAWSGSEIGYDFVEDPQNDWCHGGEMLHPDSPYCCSAECGPKCGGDDCAEIAENASQANRSLSLFGGKDSVLLCCPETIARPCESYNDTGCLLERAPTRRSYGSAISSGISIRSKTIDRLTAAQQRKQEKKKALQRIDTALFSSTKKAKAPTPISAGSSSIARVASQDAQAAFATARTVKVTLLDPNSTLKSSPVRSNFLIASGLSTSISVPPASVPSPSRQISAPSSHRSATKNIQLSPQKKIDMVYRRAAGNTWRTKQMTKLGSFEENAGVHPADLIRQKEAPQKPSIAAVTKSASEINNERQWWHKSKIWNRREKSLSANTKLRG